MITAEGLRAREGKAETWEGEALSDYPVGHHRRQMLLLRADSCWAQPSSMAALVFGAQRGRGVQHSLDAGCELQRAHSKKGQVVPCLMLDTFLLLTAAGIWHQLQLS